MPRKLRFAAEALNDLDAIRRWQIQPGSGLAAINRVRLIRNAIRRLKVTPCLYAAGSQAGAREMACEGHRVIYEVTPDTGQNDSAGDVLVLRVFGPGQERNRPT